MKERVRCWLEFAEEDLRTAQLTLSEEIFNQACFHSQQVVEKSLKALIENRTRVPKVHRLTELLAICWKLGVSVKVWQEEFEFLDKFYTLTRYPFLTGTLPSGMPDKSDTEKAVDIAQRFFSEVKSLLHGGD